MEIMWPLIAFTFFLSLASGIFFWQGILTIKGKGQKMQFASLAAALVCYAVGGCMVLLHLASPLRIFNGFGHITSGITQEVIAMVIVCLAIVVFFLMYWRSEDRTAPAWCGWMAIVTSVIMVVVMAHSYWMASVPVWNNVVYILFFLANMVAAGVLASWVIARIRKCQDAIDLERKFAFWVVLAYIVVLIVYFVVVIVLGNTSYSQVGYYFDPTLPDVHMTEASTTMASIFVGAWAPLTWIGVVIVGMITPGLIAFFTRKAPAATVADETADESAEKAEEAEASNAEKPAEPKKGNVFKKFFEKETLSISVALVALLIGGACWRVLLYATAIHVFAIF